MSSNRIENGSGLIDKPVGWSAEESIGKARRSGGAGCNRQPVVKREMTSSAPMIYIAHNEGRVSYIVQVIRESSSWSHRSGTLLSHDGRTARYLRAGQIGARIAE